MTIRTAARGRFLSIALILGAAALFAQPAAAQMAAGKAKFVGNVTGNSVPANFGTYWNQVTPENATKWGSVEGTQQPDELGRRPTRPTTGPRPTATSSSSTRSCGVRSFRAGSSGLTHDAAARRDRAVDPGWPASVIPNTWAIDVVNEPIKTALPWKAALGGDGATGWDWVITAFQIARTNCPNAKLLINEYGTENDPPVRNTYKTIINLLKTRGLIDGIGIQAHYFNIDNMNRAAVTTMLNDYATLALDVWVSELDIIGRRQRCGSAREVPGRVPGLLGTQLPSRASRSGATSSGQTWREGTGLVTTGGQERPAHDVAQGLRQRFGRRRYAGAEHARGSHGTFDDQEFDLAGVDRVDGQRGRDGLSDPARAGASGGTFAQIATSTTNSYVNTGLTASTTFRYQVRAVDAAGNASAVSNTVTATTQAGGGGDTQAADRAGEPDGAVDDDDSSMSLAWTASTDNVGVTGYQILRAPGASGGTFTQIATSTTNSYVNTGLTANTTFRYQVRATDAAGNRVGGVEYGDRDDADRRHRRRLFGDADRADAVADGLCHRAGPRDQYGNGHDQ